MYRYLASEEKKGCGFYLFMGETRINHCVHALHTNRLTSEEHFASFQLENHFFKRGKDCSTESGSGLDAGDVLDVVDDERINSNVLGWCWSL